MLTIDSRLSKMIRYLTHVEKYIKISIVCEKLWETKYSLRKVRYNVTCFHVAIDIL